jgi:hypothetical protein
MKRATKICVILAAAGCVVGLSRAQNPVTFQVDMTKLIQNNNFTNGVDTVAVAGSFNGWVVSPSPADSYLTNDPSATGDASNLYTGTIDIGDAPGTVEQYKFVFYTPDVQWESPDSTCGNNRTFTLAGGAQTLPVVYWNDQPLVLPTNEVTFSVDLTAQIQILGSFRPGIDHVFTPGGFNNWSTTSFELTNNPALSGNASNIYSGTYPVGAVPGSCQAYKYYIDYNANWESPASTGGNNRTFVAVDGPQALPTVYFNDSSPGDFLPVDTEVTFNVSMTNAVGNDGTVFTPGVDQVYLNGDFLGWWAWGAFPPAQYMMTNNPVGSLNYSLTILRTNNTTLPLTYKYSIDGSDNEQGFGVNHFRYIRQTPSYNMPLDDFGTNYTPVVEPYPGFGDLTAGPASGGNVPISWLGRPGVYLQSKDTLDSGLWTDLTDTDGTNWTSGYLSPNGFVSVTNYPAGGSSTYFRLVKP